MFKLFKSRKNRIIYFILLIIVSFSYLLFKNFRQIINVFNISVFSFSEKLKFAALSLIDIKAIFDIKMLILVLLFILSVSLFLFLIILLFKETKKIAPKKSFFGIFSILISVLGLSCISCGVGILASLLSFLGFSSLINIFPMHGLEFGYFGVLALNVSNYFLLKRLKNPYTC